MCQNKLFHSIEFVTNLRRMEENAGTSFSHYINVAQNLKWMENLPLPGNDQPSRTVTAILDLFLE